NKASKTACEPLICVVVAVAFISSVSVFSSVLIFSKSRLKWTSASKVDVLLFILLFTLIFILKISHTALRGIGNCFSEFILYSFCYFQVGLFSVCTTLGNFLV